MKITRQKRNSEQTPFGKSEHFSFHLNAESLRWGYRSLEARTYSRVNSPRDFVTGFVATLASGQSDTSASQHHKN
jgi:hypothetical protein